MRTVRLARIAAEAEVLRLRRMFRRLALDALLLLVVVLCLVAAFASGHVALFLLLQPSQGGLYSALYLAGGDLAVACLTGLIVILHRPGRVERQALEVRQAAQAQIARDLTTAGLLSGVARGIGLRRVAALLSTLARILTRRSNPAPRNV
jgi:hypothetical protein